MRRRFDDAFKQQAVAMCQNGDKRTDQIAEELGIRAEPILRE